MRVLLFLLICKEQSAINTAHHHRSKSAVMNIEIAGSARVCSSRPPKQDTRDRLSYRQPDFLSSAWPADQKSRRVSQMSGSGAPDDALAVGGSGRPRPRTLTDEQNDGRDGGQGGDADENGIHFLLLSPPRGCQRVDLSSGLMVLTTMVSSTNSQLKLEGKRTSNDDYLPTSTGH